MQITFKKAEKTKADARRVMDWRNDPVTLEMFYHQQPKNWESFWTEYRETYFQHERLWPLFVLADDEPIAFLRFNPYADEKLPPGSVDIDINIAPDFRDKGLGTKILARAGQQLLETHPVVVAEVKQKNKASIRAFEKAGFIILDEMNKHIEDTGETVPIVRLVLRKEMQPVNTDE